MKNNMDKTLRAWSLHLHMRHMYWLQLLADTGSLSETARLAHTTQPGLSKWLRDLEEDIGTPLFERHARGMRPTRSGSLLLLYSRRVLGAMHRAEEDIRTVLQGGLRRIMLGTSSAASANLIPNAIDRYVRKQPETKLGVREGTADELLEQLERIQIDLAVCRLGGQRPPTGLQHELLYVEPIVLVVHPSHPLARATTVDWKRAYRYPWIVWPSGTSIRSSLDSALAELGLAPPPANIESTSMLANLSLLRDGERLLVVSSHVANHFTATGQMVALPLQLGSAGALGMYWRDSTDTDPAIGDLIESLRMAARQMGPGMLPSIDAVPAPRQRKRAKAAP